MKPSDFLADFVVPDARFSPVPAWWWSGEPLHWPKMKWQMEQMQAMGLLNFVVIGLAPSGAMFGSDADEPEYLSEPWWDLFGRVCDHAKTLGMRVWFYDQIGFSGANFQTDLVATNPTWSGQRLKSVFADGDGELSLTCPAIGQPIGAYFVAGDDVTPVNIVDRKATFPAEKAGRLRLVYAIKQGYDYYNTAACQALLDTVHRQYERRFPQHIGTTIVGSFQDELPELPTWGSRFAETFADAFGYRIEDRLHHLFEEGDTAAGRTRVDYHNHRAALAEAALFKPFYEWYESHGMQCGYDQQSPAREARVIGCIDKYADYMRTQKWYACPGSDLHGNGKLHSAIAFLNDRPRVWLEGFHTTGWGGTIADTFDWLLPYLQTGVTLYNPHAIYYSTRKGWWEWAPPSTCWRQPYAMHYRPFADMIARLTKLLTVGKPQATVGVLFPTTTAQSAIGPEGHFADAKTADDTLHDLLGSMRWHQVKTGVLDAAVLDHLVLDEPAIQSATIRGNSLEIHGVSLRGIVLPAVTAMQPETIQVLRAFVAAGGRVVSVKARSIHLTDGSETDASTAGFAIVEEAAELADALADVPRSIRTDAPFLHRKDDTLNLLLLPAANGMATEVNWDSWFAPMEHTTIVPERYRTKTTVRVAKRIDGVRRFDPVTGASTAVAVQHDADGGTTIAIDFAGAPMAMLVWDDAGTPDTVPEPVGVERVVELPDAWQCEYVPTLPTDFADIYDPARDTQRFPTTPAVKWVESAADHSAGLPADAENIHTTFGPRGWIDYDDGRHVPLAYSPEFGIDHDTLHQLTLGPKGHVPEEFIDLGKMAAGASATVTFGVVSENACRVLMNIGTNAKWELTLGDQFRVGSDAYNAVELIELRPGRNDFSLKLTARSNATIRAFFCFADTKNAELFVRPERLITPAKPAFGQKLLFRGEVELPFDAERGTLFVATAAMSRIAIDGRLLGRQGGFDPYRLQMRGQKYPLPALAKGRHAVTIEMASPASVAPVSFDAEVFDANGRAFRWSSAADCTVSIDDGPAQPVAIQPKQDAEGAAWRLWRRPHPLPGTRWLDGGADGVLELPFTPPSELAVTQWFEWAVPPGATTMRLPIVDDADATLWIDGQAVSPRDRTSIELPAGPAGARRAVLRVQSRQLGGGVFTAAISYAFGPGALRLGSWTQQGLASYSGAIRMTTTFDLRQLAGRLRLDLGRVRGTVEAIVNGKSAGVRFMSPYAFDLTSLAVAGANSVELIVTNTLMNHLSTWSPTRWWSPDQLECGITGPVRLLAD
ncbi:MAG: hypothetical protein QM754_15365 [Tepidisphaeraceae bacterium]